MPVESAADLAAFFNLEEFGEAITVGSAGLVALWYRPGDPRPFMQGDVESDEHRFDVPFAPDLVVDQGTAITVPRTGEAFTISDQPRRSPDGALWLLPAA